MHGRGAWDACVDQPARRTHHPGVGHSVRKAGQAGLSLRAWGSTSLPSGTEPPCTGSVVSTSLPGGTQPPGLGTRVSTTEPGMNQHPVVRGRGVGRRCRPAGRRDSACGWGARGSNSRPGRNEPPVSGRGGRPAGPAGLGLRARGSSSLHRGTEPPGADRGVDQPARRDSSSRREPRGSTSRPGGRQPPDAGLRGSVSSAVLILRALGCGARPACPEGLSFRTWGSTSLHGRTEPPGSGRGGRPAGPAGLGLRAWGSTRLHRHTEPPSTGLHQPAL